MLVYRFSLSLFNKCPPFLSPHPHRPVTGIGRVTPAKGAGPPSPPPDSCVPSSQTAQRMAQGQGPPGKHCRRCSRHARSSHPACHAGRCQQAGCGLAHDAFTQRSHCGVGERCSKGKPNVPLGPVPFPAQTKNACYVRKTGVALHITRVSRAKPSRTHLGRANRLRWPMPS